mmetsp:Transcript_29971/g.86936  ORF Transcript_29971/g.86936 Transcript_29971/m.86936 type:complete len:135 (+) Transcript_29971:230-634(+)
MSRVREKLLEVGVNVALGFVEGKEEMQRAAKYLRLAQSCTDTKHSVVPPRALSTARLLQEGVVTKKVQEWQKGETVMDACVSKGMRRTTIGAGPGRSHEQAKSMSETNKSCACAVSLSVAGPIRCVPPAADQAM